MNDYWLNEEGILIRERSLRVAQKIPLFSGSNSYRKRKEINKENFKTLRSLENSLDDVYEKRKIHFIRMKYSLNAFANLKN